MQFLDVMVSLIALHIPLHPMAAQKLISLAVDDAKFTYLERIVE